MSCSDDDGGLDCRTCKIVDKEYLCTNVERPKEDFIIKWMNDEFDVTKEGDFGWRAEE